MSPLRGSFNVLQEKIVVNPGGDIFIDTTLPRNLSTPLGVQYLPLCPAKKVAHDKLQRGAGGMLERNTYAEKCYHSV